MHLKYDHGQTVETKLKFFLGYQNNNNAALKSAGMKQTCLPGQTS